MPPKRLIARELHELVAPDWLGGFDVSWLEPEHPIPPSDAVALIPVLTRPVRASDLDGLPNLQIVAASAVGVDNIDVAEAHRRGIVVTNTPDVLTESTADLTWALILGAARRVREGLDILRTAKWDGWHPTLLLGM